MTESTKALLPGQFVLLIAAGRQGWALTPRAVAMARKLIPSGLFTLRRHKTYGLLPRLTHEGWDIVEAVKPSLKRPYPRVVSLPDRRGRKRTNPLAAYKNITFAVDPATIAKLKAWQDAQPNDTTFSEAARHFLELGLAAVDRDSSSLK